MACAAGCAQSAADCGLVTTNMVGAPIEMVASIATLGTYSTVAVGTKATKATANTATDEIEDTILEALKLSYQRTKALVTHMKKFPGGPGRGTQDQGFRKGKARTRSCIASVS